MLLPPSSSRLARPLPRADEIDGDQADSLLARGTAAAQDGRTEEARRLIERAIELDPLLIPAYGQLALVYAREKNADGIAATIERGIASEPRQAAAFRSLEAVAYETLGDPERTLAALEHAVPRGPFSWPDAILKALADLRIRPAAR